MCLKWDFFGIEWNCATICKQLQIRIISENIFSLILMVYRHRKLGYPIGFITGRQASPAWMIASLQIMQMLSGFQCTYKRKYGRLHLYYETCHSFALFPYLHPCIKVKSGNVTEKCHTGILWYRGSIMEIPVEFVFFPFFYDHPLVA